MFSGGIERVHWEQMEYQVTESGLQGIDSTATRKILI